MQSDSPVLLGDIELRRLAVLTPSRVGVGVGGTGRCEAVVHARVVSSLVCQHATGTQSEILNMSTTETTKSLLNVAPM